jgi:hypothetical protein
VESKYQFCIIVGLAFEQMHAQFCEALRERPPIVVSTTLESSEVMDRSSPGTGPARPVYLPALSLLPESGNRSNLFPEVAMAEQIRGILVNEQEHQIDLATALGKDVAELTRPEEMAEPNPSLFFPYPPGFGSPGGEPGGLAKVP